MSSRETVIEFVSKLPEEMSLVEIAREVELLAGIHLAREQAVRGEGIPVEDAHKLVDAWLQSNSHAAVDSRFEGDRIFHCQRQP